MSSRLAVLATAAAVAFTMVPVGAANAASPVKVAVPAPGGGGGGGGAGYAGCYRVSHTIYGPYNFAFCLNRNKGGNYTVTGGGLNCNGGLDWYDSGNGRIDIDLYRAGCGRGTDWTGDSLSCRAPGFRPPVISGNLGPLNLSVAVPVPGSSGIDQLNCTYSPATRGYSPVSVTARRT